MTTGSGVKMYLRKLPFFCEFYQDSHHKSAICSKSINHRSLGPCSINVSWNFPSISPMNTIPNRHPDAIKGGRDKQTDRPSDQEILSKLGTGIPKIKSNFPSDHSVLRNNAP